MTAKRLRRLLDAPELIVVHLTADALRALRLALLTEHPLLDDDLSAPDDPPLQRRARALLRSADELRLALERYRRHVNRVLRQPRREDLPF